MLRLQINENSNTPKSKQIANNIKDAVFAGRLKAGDRLPSVREASDNWSVPKDSVHRAYLSLLKDGVIADSDDRGPLPRYIISETAKAPADADREKRLDGLVAAMIAQARKLGFQQTEIELATSRVLAKMASKPRRKPNA